jgi:zinc transporter ZupT
VPFTLTCDLHDLPPGAVDTLRLLTAGADRRVSIDIGGQACALTGLIVAFRVSGNQVDISVGDA